jgi:hypothetical protein
MLLSRTINTEPRRVLVACEFSGRVRERFRAKGHDAWSCDLLPSMDGSKYHIQGDVLEHLDEKWDMVIGFPPCTYLTTARNGHPVDWDERDKAIDFALKLWEAPCPRVALENPVGALTSILGKASQIIQPYQFGDPWHKRTCLWLFALPRLVPTNIIVPRGHWVSSGGRYSQNEKRTRAVTFPGIAQAMADQWGAI